MLRTRTRLCRKGHVVYVGQVISEQYEDGAWTISCDIQNMHPNIQDSQVSILDEHSGLLSVTLGPLHNPLDQVGNVKRVQGNSWFGAIFLMMNAAIGAGLLTFPHAFHQAGGIYVALSVQAVFVVFAVGALLILAVCSDVHSTATYQDVVSSLVGNLGKLSCSVCIALYSFGCCVAYLIIIGDQWEKLFSSLAPEQAASAWYMQRQFMIGVTATIIILPLCFPKRIDFLTRASALGVVGIMYLGMLVVVKFFTLPRPDPPPPVRTSPEHWTDVFLVIPSICFGYQCHVSAVPIYSCLKRRRFSEFLKTVSVSLGLCLTIYSCTGVLGYFTFGENVNVDILVSYTPTWDVLLAMALLSINIYTAYPIMHFCGRAAFETVLLHFLRNRDQVQLALQERIRRIIETLVWFFTTLVIAIFIPDITQVIDVLGGLAAVFIFLFPGLCLLQFTLQAQTDDRQLPMSRPLLIIISGAYIVMGAFIFGLTTTHALLK